MATQSFDARLRGGMRYTVQLQPNAYDVDFNVYVHSPGGQLLASDTGPEAGAECSFDAADHGTYRITVELVRGMAGFSVNIAAEPLGRAAASSAPAAPSTSGTPSRESRQQRANAGADTGSDVTSAEAQALVDAHNRWRDRFRTPPLVWSNELAEVAQDWADRLAASGMRMKHRSPNDYGENIYWCSGRPATPDAVVDAWGNEVSVYDEGANNWWPDAGHFSQVVWHATEQVGCGVARVGGQEMWVCNYDPRGNWQGQRPYPV